MITIHKRIKEMSDKQVILLIEKFGQFARTHKPGFAQLPRFSIDLSGAPLNTDVLRFILQAAAASDSLLKPEISRFFFMNRQEIILLNQVPDEEISKIDWVHRANWILIMINTSLTITYENGLWDLYPSRYLAQIQEIRELKSIILQKQVERLNGGVFIGNIISNVNGPVHLGNVIQATTPQTLSAKEDKKINLDLIKTLITEGNTADAIVLLLSCAKHFSTEIDHTAIIISSRYNNFRLAQVKGTLPHELIAIERTTIDRSILQLVSLMHQTSTLQTSPHRAPE